MKLCVLYHIGGSDSPESQIFTCNTRNGGYKNKVLPITVFREIDLVTHLGILRRLLGQI